MGDVPKTRVAKVGVAHVQEKKMEANTEAAVKDGTLTAIVNWINGNMEGEANFEKLQDGDWKPVAVALRNGVVLCQFVNKLLKEDGKSPVKVQAKANSTFQALANIENFNNAVKAYGLPQESTFQSGDLYECGMAHFFNVINCIHSLGFLANNKGCAIKYTGNLKKSD